MNLGGILKQGQKVLTDNAPAILTGVGVTGLVTTAYLTAKATFRASELIYEEEQTLTNDGYQRVHLDTRDRFELVWTLYIPAVITGALGCGAIIGANRIGTRRAAAVATAYAITEKAYSEYADKVQEKLGEKKEREIRSELAQDRVTRSYDHAQQVTVGQGDVLCHDAYTGRYFSSSMEKLRRAENDINKQILSMDFATLTNFYNAIGLEPTSVSDDVGWNHDKYCELSIDSVVTKDGRPALSFDFATLPMPDPHRFR